VRKQRRVPSSGLIHRTTDNCSCGSGTREYIGRGLAVGWPAPGCHSDRLRYAELARVTAALVDRLGHRDGAGGALWHPAGRAAGDRAVPGRQALQVLVNAGMGLPPGGRGAWSSRSSFGEPGPFGASDCCSHRRPDVIAQFLGRWPNPRPGLDPIDVGVDRSRYLARATGRWRGREDGLRGARARSVPAGRGDPRGDRLGGHLGSGRVADGRRQLARPDQDPDDGHHAGDQQGRVAQAIALGVSCCR